MKKLIILTSVAFLVLFFYFNFGANFSSVVSHEYSIKYNQVGGFKKLVYKLKKDKVITSARFMYALARISGQAKKVKAGYYTFSSRMSVLEILDILISGKVNLNPLSIKEGFDLYEVATALESNGVTNIKASLIYFHSDRLLTKIAKRYNIKKPPSAEGFFFPETYFISKSEKLESIMDMSLDLFDENIYALYKQKVATGIEDRGLYYYLTIGSLIEKEAAVDDERALVSSVIYNRLNKNMKLKFCSTIIYAFKVKGLYDQNLKGGVFNIKRSHFSYKSAYNTYYKRGLPVAPITTPSKISFIAALNPKDTDFFYFVAKNDGSRHHHFSKTGEEHVYYTDIYQKGR